jgi:hypothetical protein
MKIDFIDRVFLEDIEKQYTHITTINKALLIPSFRKYIWEHFEFSEALIVPDLIFEPSLSYGTLSDLRVVNQHKFQKLVISDMALPEYKSFMTTLATRYKRGIVEFDEKHSELDGEDLC